MIARRSSGRALSTASSWPWPTITCCWRPMPVSESSSWMSSSRHGAPLIMYSDSPVRNSVRVIVTSENSIGSRPRGVVDRERHLGPAERGPVGGAREDDVVHLAAAQRPRALRAEHPRDRVDDVRLARPVRADDDADARLELERGLVREGLEALQRQRLEEHAGPLSGARDGRGARPPPRRTRAAWTGHRIAEPCDRRIGGTLASTSTASTRRARRTRPAPGDHPVDRGRRALELGLDRAVGRGCAPSRRRARPAPARGTSRGTTRLARARSRRRAPRTASPPASHLACLAVERRAVREAGPVHERAGTAGTPGPRGRTPGGGAGTRRAGRTGRRTARRRATSRGTSPRPATSRRSRGTGAGSPAATASRSCGPSLQPGLEQDLVAVDVADAGDELLVHQQRLQPRLAARRACGRTAPTTSRSRADRGRGARALRPARRGRRTSSTNISPNVRGSTKRNSPPCVNVITTCVCFGAFSRADLRARAADPTCRGAR